MQLNRRQLLAATAIPAIGITVRDTPSKPPTPALVTIDCVESAFAAVVASRSSNDIDRAAETAQLYVRQVWSAALKSAGRDNKVLDDSEIIRLLAETPPPRIIRVKTDQPVWDVDSVNRPSETGLLIAQRQWWGRFQDKSLYPPGTGEPMGTSALGACFVRRAAAALAGSYLFVYHDQPNLSLRVYGMPRCRLVLSDNNEGGGAGGYVLSLSFNVLVALPASKNYS